MTDPITPTPITKRSGWQAVLWAALAAAIEAVLIATESAEWLPEAVRPFVPVGAAFLRFILAQIKGPTSYRAA